MKNLICAFVTLTFCATGNAGTVYFTGDVDTDLGSKLGEGTINVMFDLDPLDNFQNGGVSFAVVHDGSMQFTEATVLNPGGRWTIAADTTTNNKVEFNAFSVQSPAMPTGGQGIVFATIKYIGLAYNFTKLGYEINDESLVDGRNFGTIVTQNYTFQESFLFTDPEPSGLVLAMGLFGFIVNRRKG